MLNQTSPQRYRFDTRLADDPSEIRAVQRLRYEVFYEEMGAKADLAQQAQRRDINCFDAVCDHLMVVDTAMTDEYGDPLVVGTYRLIRRSRLPEGHDFYSEAEFDLRAIKRFPGEILELSRSCVHREYRNRAVLDMLWRGLGNYITAYQIEIMFGCASFPGTDPEQIADALTFLHSRHLAPEPLRPLALPGQYVAMQRRCESVLDKRDAIRQMPPLVRGYVGAGAFVGDGAVIDTEFNTVDVCVMVMTEQLRKSYARRYQGIN
ncbi:unnamed protein product [Phaeothamnion confervicola]